MNRNEYDAGAAHQLRVAVAKLSPEFRAIETACIAAAIAAYKEGPEYLRAAGGISKVITAEASKHAGEYDLPFGAKGRLQDLINVTAIRLAAQRAAKL